MPFSTKYLFVVSMDVDADKEDLFNEVYDTEHVPLICQVPGVRAASRIVGQDFNMQLAGETVPLAVTAPAIVPVPVRMAPEAIVVAVLASDPVNCRVPALMVVAPV